MGLNKLFWSQSNLLCFVGLEETLDNAIGSKSCLSSLSQKWGKGREKKVGVLPKLGNQLLKTQEPPK